MDLLVRVLTPAALLSLAIGCAGGSNGPSAEGQAYLLAEEPADAMSVVALKSSLVTGTLGADEVAILGRVGGGQNPTWDETQAAFLVRDMSLKIESQEHGGNHDNCKFCQAEKAKELESMVLVQMVDANGDVVPTDARELLGLKENHIIVALGNGEVDDVGNFIFSASKIYVRR